MRLCLRLRMGFSGFACLLFASGGAIAMPMQDAQSADLEPEAAEIQPGLSYRFDTCSEPDKPLIRVDPAKTGNASVKDYNRQVTRLNAYLAEVQTYMDCLTEEANRDLTAYYEAVNAALDERERVMTDVVDGYRRTLEPGPNRKKEKRKDPEIPALEGAEPVPANSEGQATGGEGDSETDPPADPPANGD